MDLRTKKFNIGDRIFFEYFDTSIGDAIIVDIEDRIDNTPDGEIKYNMFILGGHSIIESYNCLDEDDPRVIEYKKTHADPREFISKFKQFMKDNNFDVKQSSIQDYLYSQLI